MNKRQIKLSCYLEQLNIEVVKVEMILNQLNRLKNNQNNTTIFFNIHFIHQFYFILVKIKKMSKKIIRFL